jgi:hypothetical protein
MRISTSLIEFEEFPGIRTFFELEDSNSRPSSLFIVLEDRLLASLEIIRGTIKDEIDLIIERSIEAEVNSFGGFISKLDEDFPDDMTVKFTVESKEINQYHMFEFGDIALSAHLTVLSDWYEEDLDKFHKFISTIELHEIDFLKVEIGEILVHDDFADSIGNKVGIRSYLGNQLVAIE